ncbi:SDR family oxidoreductase [Zavarzinia compransoris]|uniref:Short chain dehydrogenase n=1 Tax=Zavarzinia compransoris TaxID=1264899 RepID=A0A317E2V1_9PROT|nr:SDR family oxidoreductase [Zavarzinia compransoris]PWR20951.1 short chain dehydrogenase [Zavarzinia compransoris]TDP43979.1 NAD(P)-dependent dehydrogenase (short-subunit alcohol dehydrogenase family) [Zavarzinia compransoris]
MELQDQRVLVIGGSSGIGLAVAGRAARAGARVTIASRSAERLAAAAAALPAPVETLVLDVADDRQTREALGATGIWDHIAVTAGDVRTGPIRKQPIEAAMAGMNAKFWSAWRIAAAAVIAETGSLTLTSGAFAQRPAAGRVIAGAINAAIEGLARGLALELAPVRVNVVSPGLVDTPLWAGLPAEKRHAYFETVAAVLPARRIASADDIARLYLTAMTTPILTGTTLLGDGGHVLV